MRPPAWLPLAFLFAAPAFALPSAGDGRADLASQVVGLVFPLSRFTAHTLDFAESSLKVVEMSVMLAETREHPNSVAPPEEPKIDAAQMRMSLTTAIDALTPGYRAAVTDAFARRLTVDDLAAMLAFLKSPAGAEAMRRRTDYDDAHNGDDSAYAETPAETAFYESPAGRAFKRAQQPIGQDAERALTDLWWPAMAKAEADYCAHRVCGDPEHRVFAGLAAIWKPGK